MVCKHITWLCKCECGKVKEVVSQALRDGRSKSCGCLNKEHTATLCARYCRKPKGESSFNLLVKRVQFSASSRDLAYELTRDDIRKLVTSPCNYCGRKDTSITKGDHTYGEFKHVGIDRIDNTKGYLLENCVPCCSDCNRAKRDLSVNEFFDWVVRVHKHLTENPL